jgi:hypothetical protein
LEVTMASAPRCLTLQHRKLHKHVKGRLKWMLSSKRQPGRRPFKKFRDKRESRSERYRLLRGRLSGRRKRRRNGKKKKKGSKKWRLTGNSEKRSNRRRHSKQSSNVNQLQTWIRRRRIW